MPEDSRYIRVENYMTGYVLRQSFENGEPVLKLFLMTCSDVKGMIPKWIINILAPRKPGEWIDSLIKAAKEYQRDHPNCKDELKESASRFDVDNPFDFEFEKQDGCVDDPDYVESIEALELPSNSPIPEDFVEQ